MEAKVLIFCRHSSDAEHFRSRTLFEFGPTHVIKITPVNSDVELNTSNFTVESRFLEPPEETQIGSRNRRVQEIGGKLRVRSFGVIWIRISGKITTVESRSCH